MKNIFTIVTCLIISLSLNGQSTTGTLTNAMSIEIKEGLVICGVNKEKEFKAILYDASLSILKEYSKMLAEEAGDLTVVYDRGDFLEIEINEGVWGKTGFILKLSKKLEEISFVSYNNDERKLYREQCKNEDENNNIPLNYSLHKQSMQYVLYKSFELSDALRKSFMKRGKELIFYKGDYYEARHNVVMRFTVNDRSKWTTYKNVWATSLGIGKVVYDEIIYVNDQYIFLFAISQDGDLPDASYLVCLDSQKGNIVYKSKISMPKTNLEVYPFNAMFDSTSKCVVLAGNAFQPSQAAKDFKMQFLALLMFDMTGNIIKTQQIEFPEYNMKEDRGFDFKNKLVTTELISKLPSGNYVINSLHKAKFENNNSQSPGKVIGYDVIGASYYEFNGNLEIKESKFFLYPKDKSDSYTFYFLDAFKNGSALFINNNSLCSSSVCNRTEAIQFKPGAAPVLTILASDNIKKSTRTITHVLNGDSLILFTRIKADEFELKLIKL